MGIVTVGLAVLAVAALTFALLAVFGRLRWQDQTQALVNRLEAGRLGPEPMRFDARELAGLPPVVQRYFRWALQEGAPLIAAATIDHAGTFNMGERVDNWKPFTSRQRIVTRRPGFVWNGRIAMLPGLNVQVHDAYVAGTGILRAAVLGLFTVADTPRTAELAHGELIRFLAEAAWYPTALLPSQGVHWEGLGENAASATMTDGAVKVRLTFTFDAEGPIASVRSDARGRTVGGRIEMRPWEGRWSDYATRDGMRIPMTGEVAWLLPPEDGGPKPYWRGSITFLRYAFAR